MSIESNLIRLLKTGSSNRDVRINLSLLQRKFGLNISSLILTKPNMSNADLWKFIQNSPPPSGIKAYGQGFDRAKQRAEDIRGIVNLLGGLGSGTVYLDVGSNTGEIAYALSNSLGIDLEHTYGLDEGEFSGMSISKTIPIRHIVYDGHGRIPMEDNLLDLVTILQTLHHMHDIDRFMIELRRITKLGSLVIIREHDIPSYPGAGRNTVNYFKYVVDLEHLIWSAKETKPDNTYNRFASTYWANYYTYGELRSKFAQIGFEPIRLTSRYSDPFGATRYYYAAFRKVR